MSHGIGANTILIDGRFTIASFDVSAALTKRPLSIFFDDYVDRSAYHVVEKILKPVIIVGRAACFDISPGLISVDQFLLEFAHYGGFQESWHTTTCNSPFKNKHSNTS